MYEEKPTKYYSYYRMSLINLIPKNKDNKILEIGAGGGNTLVKIKELGIAKQVVGVELIKIENSNQSNSNIDKFIIGNIENIELGFEENYFDVILCGDVLEHLLDPWQTVKKLQKYLKRGGIFIASIPNIREKSTLISIIFKGDFKYEDSGILDKTHLRFFCKKNILDLFEKNNLKVISVSSNFDTMRKGKRVLFNKLTFNLFYNFFVTQYFLVAQK